jgi:hypothetical protein
MTGEISDSGIRAPTNWHFDTDQAGNLFATDPQDPSRRQLIQKGIPYRPANEPELVGAGGRPGQGGQVGPNGKVEFGPQAPALQRFDHNGAVRTFNTENGASQEILPAQPSTPFTPEQRKAYGLDDAQIGVNLPNGQVSIQGSPMPDKFQKIDRNGQPYLQDMRDPSKPAVPMQFGSPTPLEDPVQFAARQKGTESEASAAGAGRGETLKSYMAAGEPARNLIATLTQMRAAIDAAGPNITGGTLGAIVLRAKQSLASAGIDVPGTTPTEVFNNLGPILAGAAAREITSRPALQEFNSLLRSKPGLANSVLGSKIMIDLMRQGAAHKAALSDIALKAKDADDFLEKRHAYETDPDNALINPFTGLAFGAKPQALPAGRTPESMIAQAKGMWGKVDAEGRAKILQTLRSYGINPDYAGLQ